MIISKTPILYYTEGPTMDREGNVFFTAPHAGIIYKIDANANVQQWAKSSRPNGQIILDNGDHLICDSKLGVVRRFNKYGCWIREESELRCQDGKVSTPNDLARDAEGNLYFTDSVRHEGKVWLKKVLGDQEVIADGLDYPNGIAICESGQFMYLAESYRNQIMKISMQPPYNRHVFIRLPEHVSGKAENNLPDGIALDKDDNLWIAHYGMGSILKVNPKGRLLESIPTGMPLTSNIFITDNAEAVISGGFAEPGPGAVISMQL